VRLPFISVALAFAACGPSLADETPFAAPPLLSPEPPLSLPDIMGKIQFRHIKIWYAMKSRNWGLLGYELEQLRGRLGNAVVRYQSIPIDLIVAADKSLAALQAAAKAKDQPKLERSFDELTTACNGCHQAAQVGFILIKTPSSHPFSDQEFSPREK
jgi:hypothetical protein